MAAARPLAEMATILAFVLVWFFLRDVLPVLGVAWLYTTFFVAVGVIDLEHRRVLNVMGAGRALGSGIQLPPRYAGAPAGSAGGRVGLGAFLVIELVSRGAIGAGDVKLAGVIGLMTGYPG